MAATVALGTVLGGPANGALVAGSADLVVVGVLVADVVGDVVTVTEATSVGSVVEVEVVMAAAVLSAVGVRVTVYDAVARGVCDGGLRSTSMTADVGVEEGGDGVLVNVAVVVVVKVGEMVIVMDAEGAGSNSSYTARTRCCFVDGCDRTDEKHSCRHCQEAIEDHG